MKMQHDNPTMSTRRARAMCRHSEKKSNLRKPEGLQLLRPMCCRDPLCSSLCASKGSRNDLDEASSPRFGRSSTIANLRRWRTRLPSEDGHHLLASCQNVICARAFTILRPLSSSSMSKQTSSGSRASMKPWGKSNSFKPS